MDILENSSDWLATYRAGWLAHFQQTGERNFKIYNRPRNTTAPSGPGVDLSNSRLILITSAGSYLKDAHVPFNAADPLGDYTLRTYPAATPLGKLAFAHDQYNHAPVEEDPQVLIPLEHLLALVAEGAIGELAPSVISFHGYVPDAVKFVEETIPQMVAIAQKENAHAALFVPA